MAIRIMAMVFKSGGLTPTQKLVLLALADHANEEGSSVFPSVQRLTIKTGLGERAVRKCLGDFRDSKLLLVVHKAGQHRPTEYAINVQKLTDLRHPDLHQMPSRGAPDAGLDNPGVHVVPSRGARGAPESSYNHQVNNNRQLRGGANAPGTSRKPRDERLDHPAITTYKSVTKRHVTEAWRDEVIKAVGEDPADLERWGNHLRDWLGHGWNPSNIVGILDSFEAGGIKAKGADPWDAALNGVGKKPDSLLDEIERRKVAELLEPDIPDPGGEAGIRIFVEDEPPNLEELPDEVAAAVQHRWQLLEAI
jgi:hypothetical protein